LHVDFFACKRDLASEGDLGGNFFAGRNGGINEFFEE